MYGKSKKNEALRTVNLQVFSILDISAVVCPFCERNTAHEYC